ncbi:MAG: hypothetical protein FIA97_07485 [Methylococcaceae bacterium]|nr:hypothetical protein [Methylococcaceae bacterium]
MLLTKMINLKPIFLVCLVVAPDSLWAQSGAAKSDSLCQSEETPVFSCRHKGKFYSVCATKPSADRMVLLQYRVGEPGHLEMVFPPERSATNQGFTFSLLPRGATLSFETAGYLYELNSFLPNDENEITVSRDDREIARFRCLDSLTDVNLTMTPIQALIRSAGIQEP